MIYVRAEAGIGDEFINVRFINHLKNRGMVPIWFSERTDTTTIFRRCGFPAVTHINQIEKSNNPCWVHSMDLPVLLNLQYADLWQGPYLVADPDNKMGQLIPNSEKTLKIGIRWQGNPSYDQDLHRSIPFQELLHSVQKTPVPHDIYSLQRDTGVEECFGYEDQITRLDHALITYDDTLSIMNELDLIITSCTSIAHAAAAMGKETICITPISAYYTWCHSCDKSPWYGNNLTILRQTQPRTWRQPLQQLEEILYEKYCN
jgi:hypothetical protein